MKWVPDSGFSGFCLDDGDGWFWNRTRRDSLDRGTNLKLVLGFDNAARAPQTHLLAKVRLNLPGHRENDSVSTELTTCVAVLYARNRLEDLVEMLGHVPQASCAELIVCLDNNGGTLPDSQHIRLK